MDKIEVVLDTNVPIVANGKADQADSECEVACIRELKQVQAEGRVLLDEEGKIISEYLRHLSPSGQPGLGDEFFKWLWNNQDTERYCRKVPVTHHTERGYVEFPDDERLSSFDLADRKFVAVALASETGPQVLNAVDRDWWDHHQALAENGVNVVFLCPELMVGKR